MLAFFIYKCFIRQHFLKAEEIKNDLLRAAMSSGSLVATVKLAAVIRALGAMV